MNVWRMKRDICISTSNIIMSKNAKAATILKLQNDKNTDSYQII